MLMRWFSFQHRKEHRHAQTHTDQRFRNACFLSYIHKREMAAMACGGNTKHHPGERTRGLRAARHNILRCLLQIKDICKLKRSGGGKGENWLNINDFPSIFLSSPTPPVQLLFVPYHLNTISSCPLSTLQNLQRDCDIEELKAPLPYLLPDLY